jgi:predicted regulator of Ras-like GTPase activity (Roadblock/LC7/MglB family)
MPFVRRFTTTPGTEVLTEIEAINIIDLTPPAPSVGVGSGMVLALGEFEDGPFGAGGDSPHFAGDPGVVEVFTSSDYIARFGGFGHTYAGVISNNPSARRRNGELWNGNGFLKLRNLRPQRLAISRVDSSVGEIVFTPRASLQGLTAGPFALTPGDQLSLTTDIGGPALSDAIAATAAAVAGAAFVTPTLFTGGEQVGITIDGQAEVIVTFQAADQLVADVVARINLAIGATVAVVAIGQVDFSGIQLGTGGSVALREVTAGVLATLGHAAGTTAGTGNVANANQVTATELANIINGTAALTAVGVTGEALSDGTLRISNTTSAPPTGTIIVDLAGTIQAATGLPLVIATAGIHAGGVIAAGTRVRDVGLQEFVTMQTLTVEANDAGPFTSKVRHALDDGSGTLGVAPFTLVDQADFAITTVATVGGLVASKTDPQMDNAYIAAFDATLGTKGAASQANYSISARGGAVVGAKGKQNALDASTTKGLFGRKFIFGAALGLSQTQAQTEVATFRSDRFWYTWPAWKVRIPEIAERGVAGGLGFTADGVISVRSDGPLASICARLAPEENPGQDTSIIDEFFEVDSNGVDLDIDNYIALKAAGICAPIVDADDGPGYQSGVTSVDPATSRARANIARRKMADFIQDSSAILLKPFSKKLNKVSRRDGVRGVLDSFLEGLQSVNSPELARIDSYALSEANNTDDSLALGIFIVDGQVRIFASLDAIVFRTEIGEGVVIVTEA